MFMDDFCGITRAHDDAIQLSKRKGKLQLVCRSRSHALENWLKEHDANIDIRFTGFQVYYHLNDDDLAALAYLMFK